MITVLLQGRTGNNLFQYAAGRALADHLQTDLMLDGSWANPAHAAQFETLLRLPLRARYRRNFSVPKRVVQKFLGVRPWQLHHGPVHIESSPGHDPALLDLPDESYLAGFFQSPRYFESIAHALRADLDLGTITLPPESRKFQDELRNRTTVSLHVRRGDYLAIAATQCLEPDYHDRAIRWFRDRWEGIRFCVFSDDIPWCRSHFHGPDFRFCDLPASTSDPLHDLRLMASCHHHVIVNSSYSWWGAWLDSSPDKSVIAPPLWMNGLSSEQFVPEDWHRI